MSETRPEDGTPKRVSSLDGHSLYKNQFKFCTDAYKGSGGFKDGDYLVKYEMESDMTQRKLLLYYKNYTAGVIDSLVIPVFNSDPIRVPESGAEDPVIEAFFENADNRGNSLTRVSRSYSKWLHLHGVCFAVVDNFRDDDLSKYSKENLENRKFPYVYIQKAETVSGGEVDRFGNILWIRFYDRTAEVTTADGKKETVEIYKRWTQQESIEEYIDGESYITIKSYTHALGVVPVVVQREDLDDCSELLPETPKSWGLCTLNCTVFNQDSEQRNLERACGFPMLALQTNDPHPNVEVGVDSILAYGSGLEGSVNVPQYVSPDEKILVVLGTRSEANAGQLIEIANRMGSTAVAKGGEAKSGLALSYEFMGQDASLKDTASMGNAFEKQILYFVGLYRNKQVVYLIRYPEKYKPTFQEFKATIDLMGDVLTTQELSPETESALKIERELRLANYIGYEIVEEDVKKYFSQDALNNAIGNDLNENEESEDSDDEEEL